MDNIQQPKPDSKGKAIASILLGIVTVVLPVAALLFQLIPLINKPHAGGVIGGIVSVFVPLIVLGVIAGLIGIVFGIMSLKPQRNLALTGIILCITALLLELIYLFLFLPSSKMWID